MKKITLALVVLSVISACNSTPKRNVTVVYKTKDSNGAVVDSNAKNAAPHAIIDSNNPELKKAMENGAIKGDDGMYYLSIGHDNTGCPYYTSFAPGKVTLTAVYYRTKNGGFTNNRVEADCR